MKLFTSLLSARKLTFIFSCILVLSCSTKKDAWVNRTFHQTTARYNGYFNAGEKLKEALFNLDRNYPDDFTNILPVVKLGDEAAAQGLYSYLDEVILKCSNVVQFHSMEIRRKEKNKWIDENYLLIGKARFFKQEYASALQAFDFVTRNFPKEMGAVEARVWMARVQLMRGNYNTAIGELEFVKGQRELPRRVKQDMYVTFAWANIELGNYVDAIDDLTKALSYTRKKKDKIRYTFILAQLNQKIEEFEIASILYKRVQRYNPPYIFTFHSKINRARCFDVYSGDPEQIVKDLQKMIKDDKNIEYLDQIYYALADVYYRNNNTTASVENLKLSSKYSAGNQKQLGLTYFTLAEQYFEMRNYVPAQLYYDSASTTLLLGDPNYSPAVLKRNSLQDLVDYVQTIEREDSLQRLALMSEEKRNRMIDRIIQDIEAKEAAEKEDALNASLFPEQNNGTRPNNSSGGWYFNNPTAISSGFTDFQRKWGRRNLEDNWRRKNKQSQINFENTATVDSGKVDPSKVSDPKKREFYTQDIPLDKASMAASNQRIEEAYYKLGLIYKDKLEDYREAIKTFKELLDKYPNTSYELRAYYNLYKLYEITGYRTEMENYETKIFKEYPNSDLAKLMKDPDYFNKKNPANQEADLFYASAYEMYNRGSLDSAISQITIGSLKYKDNAIGPKLALLEALTLGKLYGKERLQDKLQLVVSNHSGHEVALKAQEILDLMNRRSVQQSQAQNQSQNTPIDSSAVASNNPKGGKGNPVNPNPINPVDTTKAANPAIPDPNPTPDPVVEVPSYYKLDKNGDYMYVFIMPVEGTDIEAYKGAISNFNTNKFSLDKLVVKSFQMGKDYHIITVRGHKDLNGAMRYYRTVLNDGDLAISFGKTTFNHFVISQRNFGTFYGKRDISGYEGFFEQRLLPLQTEN